MRNIFAFICMCYLIKIFSQNDVQLSYMPFVRQVVNPAATGQSSTTVINIIHRQQWTGISEAPITSLINFQHFFPTFHVAVGLNLMDDQLGLEHTQTFKTAYAYRLFFSEQHSLAFGLAGGIIYKKVDVSRFRLDDQSEAINIPPNCMLPDFDGGVEWKIHSWMIGVSATHIGVTFAKSSLFLIPMHFYGYIRKIHTWSPYLQTDLSYAIQSTHYKTLHEIHMSLLYRQMVYAGVSFRWNESVVFMGGMEFGQRLRVGYSFDSGVGRLPTWCSHGSHEIFLQYRLQKDITGQPSPRFFD
ncbi:MAG: PorP/SprF family type IX secretion system membrane protein [Bacteroidales bacterium]|nr:PorP/SprF family type IX secretion system membrane protein [Bacteroidales bacterium]